MNRTVIAGILVGLLATWTAQAQNTELTVSEGAVEVQTTQSSTRVRAGQKVTVSQGQINLKIDEPLVENLLALDPLVQDEKKSGMEKIDNTSVQIHSLEGVNKRKVAALLEVLNRSKEDSRTITLGPTGWDANAKVYSMTGRLLAFKAQPAEGGAFMVTVNYPEAVKPGGIFRMIVAMPTAEIPALALKAEGKLWSAKLCNDTRNSLNYWQLVLPKSAVFVDATLRPLAAHVVDDRMVMTFRKYTGPSGEGTLTVMFLWPDHDRGSLIDLPGEYRGKENTRAAEYRQKMAEIYAGKPFADQSTPVNALLSLNSAVLNKDAKAMSQVGYMLATGKMKVDDLKAIWPEGQRMVRSQEMLSTPNWPEHPEEGYIHPIYMRGRDSSQVRVDTLAVVYSKGKWYYLGNMGNPNSTDVSEFKKVLEQPATQPADRIR